MLPQSGALPQGLAAAHPRIVPRPRPAAAVRAGLFPWVPVCLSAGIGLWFLRPTLLDWQEWVAVAGVADDDDARLLEFLRRRGPTGKKKKKKKKKKRTRR